jgi:hypothetical protein
MVEMTRCAWIASFANITNTNLDVANIANTNLDDHIVFPEIYEICS